MSVLETRTVHGVITNIWDKPMDTEVVPSVTYSSFLFSLIIQEPSGFSELISHLNDVIKASNGNYT